MNIFDRIEQNIALNLQHQPKNRIFEWSLPRQSGATTWLCNKIADDIRSGKNVVFASNMRMHSAKKFISEKLYNLHLSINKTLFIVNEHNFNNLRGRTIHRIYGDNLRYWDSKNKREFLETIYPALPAEDSYILILNTTNGDVNDG